MAEQKRVDSKHRVRGNAARPHMKMSRFHFQRIVAAALIVAFVTTQVVPPGLAVPADFTEANETGERVPVVSINTTVPNTTVPGTVQTDDEFLRSSPVTLSAVTAPTAQYRSTERPTGAGPNCTESSSLRGGQSPTKQSQSEIASTMLGTSSRNDGGSGSIP